MHHGINPGLIISVCRTPGKLRECDRIFPSIHRVRKSDNPPQCRRALEASVEFCWASPGKSRLRWRVALDPTILRSNCTISRQDSAYSALKISTVIEPSPIAQNNCNFSDTRKSTTALMKCDRRELRIFRIGNLASVLPSSISIWTRGAISFARACRDIERTLYLSCRVNRSRLI